MTGSTKAATKKKSTRGRKTRYAKSICAMVQNYCLLGATDTELAAFLEISERTLNNWKKAHPEFMQSIKDGKEIADAKVGMALFQRATGYSHNDVHISNYQGDITETEIVKHFPPDPTSMIFWLKNRQKEKWRDVKAIEGGDPEQPLVIKTVNYKDA